MRNYTHILNEGFNSYFNKLNESGEELPINYLENDLKSDVYNALSDVAFKYHQKGADITEDEMDKAIEWFQLTFWEGDDSDFDSMNESYNYNLNTDIYNALGNVMFEYHLKGIDVTEEDVDKALDDFKERFFHSLTDDDYEDMDIEFSNDMYENFTHKSNKSLKESKLNEEFEDYCVTIGFCGMIGVEQEYTIYAEDEDSARMDALNEAEYDLEVENISDNGDGTFDVEVSFCGFIGCEEIFTVDAEDEDEAEEAALELAKDNLDILSIDIDMEESYKPKKNRLKEAANKKIVTIGLYGGDEVPGIYDISELVKYFKSKGLSISDVSGNIDYGWEMNITGSPRDIFFAVQNKIPGYDSDSIDEFISEYRIDESLNESNEEKNIQKGDWVVVNKPKKDIIDGYSKYMPSRIYGKEGSFYIIHSIGGMRKIKPKDIFYKASSEKDAYNWIKNRTNESLNESKLNEENNVTDFFPEIFSLSDDDLIHVVQSLWKGSDPYLRGPGGIFNKGSKDQYRYWTARRLIIGRMNGKSDDEIKKEIINSFNSDEFKDQDKYVLKVKRSSDGYMYSGCGGRSLVRSDSDDIDIFTREEAEAEKLTYKNPKSIKIIKYSDL